MLKYFFAEVRLENVEVLLSSVEYRVAQLEAMLKPQQLWDSAKYIACSYNTPAHWRNTGFQDSYSSYQDTSRLSSYGASRYPPPSFLPMQQPAPYLLEPPAAVSTYVYPPAGSTTLPTSTVSTASLPLAVTAVSTSTASLASALYTPLVTMVSTPLSASAVPTSFVAAAPSSVVTEISSQPETLSSTSTPPPGPLPVGFDPDRTYLPSSAIAKELLKSVDQVLAENSRYVEDLTKHVGTLSQVLAREAFFGKDVILQCTPKGKFSVGLPRAELQLLKNTMFSMFPKYRTCPIHFEPIWKKCVTAIEMACRRERNKEDKGQK